MQVECTTLISQVVRSVTNKLNTFQNSSVLVLEFKKASIYVCKFNIWAQQFVFSFCWVLKDILIIRQLPVSVKLLKEQSCCLLLFLPFTSTFTLPHSRPCQSNRTNPTKPKVLLLAVSFPQSSVLCSHTTTYGNTKNWCEGPERQGRALKCWVCTNLSLSGKLLYKEKARGCRWTCS